jgi:hypothetical protein
MPSAEEQIQHHEIVAWDILDWVAREGISVKMPLTLGLQ